MKYLKTGKYSLRDLAFDIRYEINHSYRPASRVIIPFDRFPDHRIGIKIEFTNMHAIVSYGIHNEYGISDTNINSSILLNRNTRAEYVINMMYQQAVGCYLNRIIKRGL